MEHYLAHVALFTNSDAEETGDRVKLMTAKGRNIDGSPRYPSRFILDISPELLEYTEPPEEGLVKEARDYIEASERYLPEKQAEAFTIGQRVRHEILGPGTVVDVDTGKGAHIVRFDGIATPRAISFRAKLEEMEE